MTETRWMPRVDWWLLSATLPLLAAGLVTMNSFTGDNYFAERQIIWILLSLLVFFGASVVDWQFLRRTGVVVTLYASALVLLGLLLLFGPVISGVRSWINFGAFSFQPVDLAKIILILTLAKYFSRRHIEIAHYRHIIVSAVYTLIPLGLVLIQPDLGSAAIVFLIWFGLVLVSGISRRHIIIVLTVGVVSALVAWFFILAPYQKDRILTFVDPLRDVQGSGYNAFQSMIAIGSGEIMGKGIGFGTQSRLEFLPEYQTDFVFAAFAEEWGFLGAILLFGLFLFIIWRVLQIAMAGASNFEVLFGVGIAVMLMSHIIINVGMNTGLLPVTGITLPFLSYGGSHLIIEFLGLGMLMGMRRYSHGVHREDTTHEFLGIGS